MATMLLEQLPLMGVNALIGHRVLKLMAESGESPGGKCRRQQTADSGRAE